MGGIDLSKLMPYAKANLNKSKKEADYILKNNYITEPPIDIKELVGNYDLVIKYAKFPENMANVCGFLDIVNKEIYVNVEDSPYRQNFTIAHELGHWIMHKEMIAKDPSAYKVLMRQPIGGEKDYREIEANAFAANLLVPTEMLKVCKKANLSSQEMVNIFGVSSSVIGFRLKNEGFI